MSVELRQTGIFEGRSTNWATAPPLLLVNTDSDTNSKFKPYLETVHRRSELLALLKKTLSSFRNRMAALAKPNVLTSYYLGPGGRVARDRLIFTSRPLYGSHNSHQDPRAVTIFVIATNSRLNWRVHVHQSSRPTEWLSQQNAFH